MERSSEVGSHDDGSPLDWSRSSLHVPRVRQSPLSTVNYGTCVLFIIQLNLGSRAEIRMGATASRDRRAIMA